jgi:PAS domain S-box-containing protein
MPACSIKHGLLAAALPRFWPLACALSRLFLLAAALPSTMRKTLRLIPILLCVGFVCHARPIRIGVESNSPPLSYVDAQNSPVGFSAELLTAMEETGEVDFEIVPNYWTEILRQFEAGTIDALANVTITETRRATMDFSISHAYVHGLIYYPKGAKAIRTTKDFPGKTIGTLVGSIGYFNAIAHQGWGARIITYPSWQAALDDAKSGKIDAALFIRSPASSGDADITGLDWWFVDDVVHEYHIAVRKGDAHTLEQINEALATVRANGTFDRIYAKWIGPLEPHPIRLADLKPYYMPSAVVLAGLLALFIWQRRMMRRLARQARELQESEQRWSFALESSGDGVWDWNARTGEVMRSRRWKEMLGYAEHEIGTGFEDWRSLVHPDDLPTVLALRQANHEGVSEGINMEYRLRCKDGSWKWVRSRGRVVEWDSAGKPLRSIGTHTDLTASRQAEEDRLILGKLESTGVLAGGIAHDFNNLLTAILLNLDLARYHKDSAGEMLTRVLSAEKAALAARSLTQQLITFARGGASVPKITDVGQLIVDSIPLVLSGSTVRAELNIAPDLYPAEVDPGQVGQVLRNLVLNAREAMPKGGVVTLSARNVSLRAGTISGLEAADYLHITVQDEGEGILPENLAKIFDPYFSTKQRGPQKGMGLGLTICHSVIKKHGGALTVESEPGRGTIFHIYLPAMHASPPGRNDSNHPLPGQAEVPWRILVMDDEMTVQETLTQTLRAMGHLAEAVSDGQTAVQKYRQSLLSALPYDLLILDLTIPGGMGGCDTLKTIREMDPGVVAIVMSGYTGDEAMSNYKAFGFRAALTKPFASDVLAAALTNAMCYRHNQ